MASPPCQSPGHRDAKIPKTAKMPDLEKDLINCLLCNNKVGSSARNSISIDNSVTNSERSVLGVLCSTLQISIVKENAQSTVVCKKCFKLLNEADELEIKLKEVKQEIYNLFKKTSEKVLLSEKKDDVDHDYVENSEVKNAPSVVQIQKVVETKKKGKKVTIIEPEKTDLKNVAIDKISESSETTEINVDKLKETEKEEDHISDNDSSNDLNGDFDDDLKAESSVDSQTEILIDTKNVKKQKDKTTVPKELAVKQDDSYTCVICNDEEKRDAKTIISHLKNEHDARLYICDVCGDMFTKRTDLSHHLDDHVAKEEGDFQCEVCNRIFSNLRLFRIHKRIHYPQIKSWSCDNCGKRYSSKNLLDEHMNTHTGNRPYICEVCGKDFASKYTHRAHVKTHEVRPRPFNCTQCNKSFLSQQNLSQHVKTHNGIKEFVCQQCGKAFGSQHNLEVHNIVHTGYKPYICRTCGKAFARKAEIRDHERTHTGEKPYQCEFCGATFSQRSNLQSHKRATHYNDKRYKCDECGKGFKRRRLLDYHIKAAHTGERPYKCETCAATFVYPEHFKKHMRIHTGEKPYLCEVCGKAFNSRDNRNAHRFIHSDKKPYECLVCGAGFMRKPLLYAHMQSQGHLNDTIVVNQPRLTTEEDMVLQDNNVHLVVQDDGDQLNENAQLIVAELKENQVIIQDGNHHKILNLTGDNVTGDDINQLVIDGQLAFEEDTDVIECKQEVSDGVEEVYGYQDDEGNTIVLRPGTDIKELLGDGNKTMQLVQIRIPANADAESRDWLNLVQGT